MLYTGFIGGSYYSHAFVIDGYSGRYFSINYGWEGGTTSRTGHDLSGELGYFYTLSPVDGHEEDLLVFNEAQEMLYKIQPDTGREYELSSWINKSPVILNWDFTNGTTFNIRMGFGLDLYDFESFKSIDVSVWLFNQDLKPKEMISEIHTMDKSYFFNNTHWGVSTFSYSTRLLEIPCHINSIIQQGDRIHLCLLGNNGTWIPIMPLRRSDYIEFSLRPISDLVSIGCTSDNPFPNETLSVHYWDYYNSESRASFYIFGYKDLYWTLKGPNLLINPGDYDFKSVYFDDSNVVHYFFNLSSGDYQLTIRNANEEVMVYFSL